MDELKRYLAEIVGFVAAVLALGGGWYADFRPPVQGNIGFGVASTAAVLIVLWVAVSLVRPAARTRLQRMVGIAAVVLLSAFAAYFWARDYLVHPNPLTTAHEERIHGLWYTPDARRLCPGFAPNECVKKFGATDEPWSAVYPAESQIAAGFFLLFLYCLIAVSLSALAMVLTSFLRAKPKT